MIYYAIGRRRQAVRMTIRAFDETIALANCEPGEVAVKVDGPVSGKISADGTSVVLAGVDMAVERDRIKSARAAMLSACDWTMGPDSPFSDEKKCEWQVYRQALRDITETQPDTPFDDIVWPDEPEK